MQITVEPYQVAHGIEIMGDPSPMCREILKKYAEAGPAYTGRLADGRILGCAGLMVQAPWVADGWMLPTPLIGQYPIAFHKLVKDSFGILVKSLGLRRVQVAVDASMPRRCVWIERMGFQREGLMRRFGSLGEDMYLYALLIGD